MHCPGCCIVRYSNGVTAGTDLSLESFLQVLEAGMYDSHQAIEAHQLLAQHCSMQALFQWLAFTAKQARDVVVLYVAMASAKTGLVKHCVR